MNTLTLKPQLASLLFATVFLVSCSIVYAQSDSADTEPVAEQGTSTEQTRPERMLSQERTPATEQQAERGVAPALPQNQHITAEQRIQLHERAQERILNLAANISNRMEAAITRIDTISLRLESRISKLETQGMDTTEARAALASAKLSLNAASLSIANIDELVTQTIRTDDVRKDWIEVRKAFLTTRDHLLTAQAELRTSVAALKQAPTRTPDTEPAVATPADATVTE